MKISDGRINYLSRKIATQLTASNLISGADVDAASKEIKRAFNYFLQAEDAVDAKVREKIGSLKRGVPEGSSEWEILYRQYYNEELEKM